MNWIKASEDSLPPQATANEFHIKYKGRPYTCKCIAKKFVFREGVLPGATILGKEHYDDIYWLDESSSIQEGEESNGDAVEDKFVPPDPEDVCWNIGSKSFTRKDVAFMLYTQRAMISNDLKCYCGNELTDKMFDILKNPRKPVY